MHNKERRGSCQGVIVAISKFETSVLKSWFSNWVTKCGGDARSYDFDAFLDRSLGYYENKSTFEKIVNNLCGGSAEGTRKEQAEMQQIAVEADRYHAEQLSRQGMSCKLCGTESHRIDGVSAEMNKLICEMLCNAGIGRLKKREYHQEVYEEY